MKTNTKLLCGLAALSLAVLTACGPFEATAISDPTVTESSETAASESSPDESSAEPEKAGSDYPVKYTSSATAEADLDGDGTPDKISFTPSKDDDDYICSKLNVNGTESESLFQTPDCFWICDIDTTDNLLEIGVSSVGMSDDYETEFYRLENGTLKSIGSIGSMIEGAFESPFALAPERGVSPVFNGDGSITANYRLDIFQTWFAKTTYRYDPASDAIKECGDMYYPYGKDKADDYKKAFDAVYAGADGELNIPTTKAEIGLYSDTDKSSSAVKLAPQQFMATATDNKNWVYIVGEDGTKGWLYIEEWDTATDASTGESFKFYDVMENLFLYD